jgi:ATP-dependent DNA helicase RecG
VLVDEIKKTIIAFANSDGGVLYIGVEDNGEVAGLENVDEVLLQVNNMIRDSIKPDITMFVQSTEEREEEKSIVAVKVCRGTERPYYLGAKGLRPTGVFVRQWAASVPASDTAIRRMIKETDGESFEELRSLNQELSFGGAKAEFDKRGVDFGKAQMMTLKLMNNENIYTILGLLLSDQCPHSIKAAVFQDNTMAVFKDRREFEGSLFKQLGDAYDFIAMHNPIRADFNKLIRIDTRSFPESAVREALLNALVHREYAMNGSVLIKIFPDRIEFISIGGLLHGVELEDIMSGFSICRNKHLADVFYRLRLIEAYGTGMQKIFEAYKKSGVAPTVDITPNVFKVILPNVNINSQEKIRLDISNEIHGADIVLKMAAEKGSVSRKDIEALFGVSQSSAIKFLNKLTIGGALIKKGNGKNTQYCLAQSEKE